MTSQAPTSRGPTDAGLTARVLSSEWQPIKTAPKNGDIVDLLHIGGAILRDQWWIDDDAEIEGGFWPCQDIGAHTFTHWRSAKTLSINLKGAA